MSTDTTDNVTFGFANRPPFAQLPDWVGLANISNNAKILYWHLAMHVNFRRGDRDVWPARSTLARRMGYKRADKIDPFIKELISIGAVEKVRQQRTDGGDANNHYLVSFLAPEGHRGPESLTEAYLRDRAAEAKPGQTPALKSGPPSNRDEASIPAPRTPAPDSGLGGEPSNEGWGGPRNEGGGEPSNEGPNKKKLNQTKLNHPPTPRTPEPARAAATAGQDGGKGSQDHKDDTETLVDAVKAARPAWSRGAIRTALQHPDVQDRPRNLWQAAFLAVAADQATQSPGRLAADGPWWAAAAAAVNVRPAAPPKCDGCNPFRRLEDGEGNDVGPCPTCHPSITDA